MFASTTILGLSPALSYVVIVLLLIVLVFELAMFWSVLTNRSLSATTKLLWVVAMLLIHPFIAIIYYFTDHRKHG